MTDIDEKTLDAIIEAYFPVYLSEPETARARANTAYTVASATAAALVAAGAFADIQSYSWPVQTLGILSVFAWVASAYLFMRISRAVTRRRLKAPPEAKDREPSDWARTVLSRARDDAREIESRLSQALTASAVALALTVLTFVAVLVFPAQPGKVQATLELTQQGDDSLNELCSVPVTSISGDLMMDTLDDDYVVIEIPAGGCKPTEAVELRIPPGQIETVVSKPRSGVIPDFG